MQVRYFFKKCVSSTKICTTLDVVKKDVLNAMRQQHSDFTAHFPRAYLAILISAAFALFTTLNVSAQPSENKLIIGLNCLNLENCQRPEMEDFFREAYTRAGHKVEFRYAPMLRNYQLVQQGQQDAGFVRTLEALEQSTSLVPVPYPLFHIRYYAMYLRDGITVKTLDDLKNYNTGVPRGHLALMKLAREKGIKLNEVKDLANAFRMMKENRLDLVFMNRTLADEIVTKLDLEDTLKISEPVHEVVTYHFVHKRHRTLAPKLARIFQEMHDDGTSQRLLKSKQHLLKQPVKKVSFVY
ncbi:MAG: transporter substrate-binding domain-containing protein [Sneathiella sp.]|nr:transporter substrate-binding domain-containing protein [Sneathiella sp.]